MSVLCYHAVQPYWRSPLAIEPTAFAEQCSWLARHRTVLPLAEAVHRLDASGRLPRGQAALTFDDGFTSLYEHALPTLVRHRLSGTVFLVAETLTSAGRPVDWVDTPPSWPLTTLTLAQILEMRDAGISFGSHSFSHRILTALGFDECVADLRRSRELLEDLLGESVPFLAYPRGRHDDNVRMAAEKAGYSHSFALPESREPTGPHSIPRVGIYPGNGVRSLRLKTTRFYLPLRTSAAFPVLRRLAFRGPAVRVDC